MNQNVRRLVETAMLFAVAMILSFVVLFTMPWGGSVTLCSSLPIVLISYRYGIKWGLFAGFVFSILQLLTGLDALRGISGTAVALSIILDYILAFTVLGFGGLFRNRIKSAPIALGAGAAVALFGRFLCSFVSGFLIWGEWAEWTLTELGTPLANSILENFTGYTLSVVYSLFYNAMYMVPEIIITTIVAVIIANVPQIKQKVAA